MAEPTRIPSRQLDLGAASYFRVLPETPPGNQVTVRTGFVYAGGHAILDQFSGGEQTTPSFAPVGAAQQRYDLVYLDIGGVASILQGTAVAFGSPIYDGAPGFNNGPPMPDQALPVAYVFVDELGAVVVDLADITILGGQFQVTRDYEGYVVDKGAFGAAPTGASDDVSALFVGETPGGDSTTKGVVTTAPLNYVQLLDQNGDELVHTASGSNAYGRITWAAGIWTLSYYYRDAAGVETAIATLETEVGPVPTDLLLAGVPKVFSRNDPARPLFQSNHERQTDQVVGTFNGLIPIGGYIDWQNPAPAVPNPSPPAGFEFADGGTVTTPGSPMLGQTKANLMVTSGGGVQGFVRGADITVAYGSGTALVGGGQDTVVGGGVTGGAGGHSHSAGSHSHSVSINSANLSADGSHTHGGLTGGQNPSVAQGNTGLGAGELLFTFADRRFTMFLPGSMGAAGSHTHPAHSHTGNTGGAGGNTGAVGDHTHSLAGGNTDNRPVFVELAKIVRVI